MFEKHEKWFVLGIIALVIYYFYKKGSMANAVNVPGTAQPSGLSSIFSEFGSIVNPTQEPGSVQPAQGTSPVNFTPAQPSTVPISQRVSAGQFNWYPAPPVLRTSGSDIYGVRQYTN